jgi:hypothetical protein
VNVVTNVNLAARRRRQAAWLSFGGLLILLIGLGINLLGVRAGAGGRPYVLSAYAALIAGSVMSWLGMALSDRWALPPRADAALGGALKGAGPAFRLYNWALPADHVLLTPSGLVVFAVFNHEGPVDVQGARWRDRRPLWRRLIALGRRAVRDPSRVVAIEVDALRRALFDQDEGLADVAVEAVAVFTRPGIALSVREPTLPVMRVDELRDWLRARSKQPGMPTPERRRLERALEALAAVRLAKDERPATKR